MTAELLPIRRALLSVSNKTGITDFARALQARGVEILSTGGTATLLSEAGIAVTEVSSHTGFPEIMDGRVKTLHPRIHGGILGRYDVDDAVMREHDIAPIDLVVVNLYPFIQTVAKPDCTLAEAIENIDIGGPAMVRAAAKNQGFTGVVVDPEDYAAVLQHLDEHQGLPPALRFHLAVKAFAHTAAYDGAVANYLSSMEPCGNREDFPRTLNLQYERALVLRYGENPHQRAAFYADLSPSCAGVATARQLQGKALSFNNIADTDAALECVRQFTQAACVIVKHANPCGVAVAESLQRAYERAYQTDPTSAFGGIIAFNQPLDEATARAIIERQFVEVIIAPDITPEASTVLASKANVRVLACGALNAPSSDLSHWEYRGINGGVLMQERDLGRVEAADLQCVSQRQPTAAELRDLLFAWQVAKFVKSNAIVYARDEQTIGIGAGQMSRVYSARIAAIKAADEKLEVAGSVMASDAFFPFRDGIDAAHQAGIRAVIQPGGSMRDAEVIAAADEHDIAMVFTGMRHFRH